MAAGPGQRIALALVLLAGPTAAADLGDPGGPGGGSPRFFPRSGETETHPPRGGGVRPLRAGCTPRRAPVPTNAPDDPSYVGSEYGLSHPSYYGFTPPPGVDEPFGRSPLPYCP